MKSIAKYMRNNRSLVNIVLVYLFLSFVIGYLDFDRRVCTFAESTYEMKRVVLGTSSSPIGSRVLVPFTLHFIHNFLRIPLIYIYATFRLSSFFLAFCLFHIYLKNWFDDKIAMIGTLSVISSLPLFLTNWYSLWSDMPNFIAFILGAMWIKQNRYKLLYILIPVATLNKEAILAIVVFYFVYNFRRENFRVLARRTVVCFGLWAIPYAYTRIVFGFQVFPGGTIKHNIAGLFEIFKNPHPYNHYYFLLYLCGFYWVLAFRNFRKKDVFLRRSVIVMALLFLYVFIRVGAINEVRVFIPFYVFIIPLGLFSLFGEDES